MANVRIISWNIRNNAADARLDNRVDFIGRVAARYQELLKDVPELHLPPAPDADNRHFDIYQNYEIEADRRDALKDYLKEKGVGSVIQWAGQPLHTIKALGLSRSPLPKTDKMFERCLMIPIHLAMSDSDVDHVANSIRAFYGR